MPSAFRKTLETVLILALLAAAPASAQTVKPPATNQGKVLMAEDVFTNIQVLRGIPVNQFMETMGFMSAALGYNCTNCHGLDVLGNWPKYAVDTPEKRQGRRMVQIVNTINKTLFGGREAVTCFTCHRGSPTPRVVPSLMEQYSEPAPDDPNDVEPSRRQVKGPSVDEIFARYLEAIGGADKAAALTSFVGKGRYEGFDSYHGKVPVDYYTKSSGERSVVAHTQNGDSVNTYDGRNAWIAGPDKPVGVLQLVPGGDLDGAKLESVLAFPAKLKTALTDLRTGFPTTLVNEKAVNIVQGKIGTSRVKLFFDAQTGLLTRVYRQSHTAIGSVPVQIEFSDYREVAGVKVPFEWKLTWTDGQSQYNMDEMQANVSVDASKFAKPVPPAKPVVAPLK
ncbi:MAG: photosynthetic reaction center cytochrome c subunit family protein [Bryobacteraceae bacterium]